MTTLELNADEERIVRAALEAYTHLHLGSFANAADRVLMSSDLDPETVQDARQALEFAQACLTGHRHGGPSITNPKVSNDARIARRLKAVLDDDQTALRLYNRDGTVNG